MRLWNDYEGTVIAGAYPIEKLIRPEGRSAFFSTKNGTGTPAVLRLIEAINDESEILTRWKAVAALDEAHLIKLKSFGQTVFEGTPLIYLLMEESDASLSDILRERTLSVEETREIATSLVDAVQALHAANIVHEHIDPSSVLATGEVVKLRSDCIREAPEGDEGFLLKRQDVHDLSLVLLRALTQHRSLDALGATRLPALFDQIIRNGINGSWGLAQIAAALRPPAAPVPVAPMPTAPVANPAPVSASTAQQQLPLAMPALASATPPAPASFERAVPVQQPGTPPQQSERVRVPVVDETRRNRLWIAIAPVVIVICAAVGWHALHTPSQPAATSQPVTTLADPAQPKGASAIPPAAQSQPAATPAQPVPTVAEGDAAHRWRVIAYTYNRQDQAQHKADQIAQRGDSSLQPEVFTITGGAPYLVTLGGYLTREDAAALRAKAISAGLPHDVYIQNYKAKSDSAQSTSEHRSRKPSASRR